MMSLLGGDDWIVSRPSEKTTFNAARFGVGVIRQPHLLQFAEPICTRGASRIVFEEFRCPGATARTLRSAALRCSRQVPTPHQQQIEEGVPPQGQIARVFGVPMLANHAQ